MKKIFIVIFVAGLIVSCWYALTKDLPVKSDGVPHFAGNDILVETGFMLRRMLIYMPLWAVICVGANYILKKIVRR